MLSRAELKAWAELKAFRWKPEERAAKNARPHEPGHEREIILTVINHRKRIPPAYASEVAERLIASMPSFTTVEQFIDWLEREMRREEESHAALPL